MRRTGKSAPSSDGADAAELSIAVGLVSLGCAKNLVDTQVMAGAMLRDGIRLAPSPDECDVILVNTCSFIGDARSESYAAIRDACRRKRAGLCRAVVVTGCLPQRYRERMLEETPDVDAFIGVDELDAIGDCIRGIVRGDRPASSVSTTPRRLFEPPVPGLALTGGPYAYLKVGEGCNHACAFCAIPGIRGRRRSRTTASIVSEAESLLAAGRRELVLISQDVTSYGADLGDGTDLAGLLRALDRIGGRFWIRWLYGFPSLLTDRILAAMAESPRVCRYVDVPIQHSHPDILRAMRRAGTAGAVAALPGRARSFMPDVALRTTCLLGFPGEREEHVRHLLDTIEQAAFDHLGAFVFSPEEGTPAFDLPGRPSLAAARKRRERVMLAQQRVVARRGKALVGAEAELLLERPVGKKPGEWTGRTAREAPEVDGEVRVKDVPAACRAGDFVRIRYTRPSGYDMISRFVGLV